MIIKCLFLIITYKTDIILRKVLTSFRQLMTNQLRQQILQLQIQSLSRFIGIREDMEIQVLQGAKILFLQQGG